MRERVRACWRKKGKEDRKLGPQATRGTTNRQALLTLHLGMHQQAYCLQLKKMSVRGLFFFYQRLRGPADRSRGVSGGEITA